MAEHPKVDLKVLFATHLMGDFWEDSKDHGKIVFVFPPTIEGGCDQGEGFSRHV